MLWTRKFSERSLPRLNSFDRATGSTRSGGAKHRYSFASVAIMRPFGPPDLKTRSHNQKSSFCIITFVWQHRASEEPLAQAEIGIIGGSGLYSMPGLTKVKEVRLKTPFGKPSDAYVVGTLEGRKVAFLARHARGHRILPTELNFRANIYGFKQLGVERIVSISAVGSLKEEHKPLEFVIPDQFFDRTRHRVDTFFGNGIVAHIAFADPICPQLAQVVEVACKKAGVTGKRGGTYVCMEGPQFSTKAESNVYRSLGHGRDRHDQLAGSQAGPRGGNLLRHGCHGHRLRLLASAS